MHTPFEYYLFYKPFKVMSQFSEEGDKETLANFFKDIRKDVYPVGRLDYDSEGLLLLTNDKQLNHRLLHPAFVHHRTYWAQVEGIPTPEAIKKLQQGTTISIDGKAYKTKPAQASWMTTAPEVPERNPPIRFRQSIPTSWLSLTLTEGKNRQVRKMTASVDLPTLRLIRYSIGNITIQDMQPGTIIQADNHIIKDLFAR